MGRKNMHCLALCFEYEVSGNILCLPWRGMRIIMKGYSMVLA